MTHIVIISTSFPINDSGAEAAGSFVADFAQELSKKTQVTVLAPGYEDKYEEKNTYNIRRFAVPRLPLSNLKLGNLIDSISILRTVNSGTKAITELHKDYPYDYIFALWALPSGYWANYALKKYGVPYSIWALGSDIWSLGKYPLIRGVLKKVLQTSHYCFADGYELQKEVESISHRKCEFLPSTRTLNIRENIQSVNQPPYKLAFLGRWHRNKGVDLLLEALEMLSETEWSRVKEIRICGGGPMEEIVSVAIEKLKSKGRPVFKKDYLDKEKATELLMWADYLLIPSRIESIPVVFSDAMQCGVPVVATPVGDLPRLLQEYKVGVLAHDVTSIELYKAICTSLNKSPSEFTEEIKLANLEFNLQSIVDKFNKYIDI